MKNRAGVLSSVEAFIKPNPLNQWRPYINNLTIRNQEMPERLETKAPSKDIFKAGLKSLRFYRKVCRLMPFILRVHDMLPKVTPIQAKIFVANHFRKNASIKEPHSVDALVQDGYEHMMEFEWHFAPQAYIYRFLAPEHLHRDEGRNLIDKRFDKVDKKASGFLTSFYNAPKSHEL